MSYVHENTVHSNMILYSTILLYKPLYSIVTYCVFMVITHENAVCYNRTCNLCKTIYLVQNTQFVPGTLFKTIFNLYLSLYENTLLFGQTPALKSNVENNVHDHIAIGTKLCLYFNKFIHG